MIFIWFHFECESIGIVRGCVLMLVCLDVHDLDCTSIDGVCVFRIANGTVDGVVGLEWFRVEVDDGFVMVGSQAEQCGDHGR